MNRLIRRSFSNGRYVDLTASRGLIAVRGEDRLSVLQNLITNDIQNLGVLKVLHSFMLNAKGRVMFDIMLYDVGEGETVIECDRGIMDKVFKHLKMYKIRKQMTLEREPNDFTIGHVLGNIDSPNEKDEYDYSQNGTDLMFWDPRQLRFGKRTLATPNNAENVPQATIDDYTDARYQMGLVEGAAEIEFGKAFPLEHNLDHTSGISFHKGCYLGQELTARTFHTGVTRKRIVPIRNLPLEAQIGDDLKNERKRRAGKLIARNDQNNGLIMFRVENFGNKVTIRNTEMVVEQPDWWKRRDPKTLSFGICDDFRHADYESFSFNY